MAPNIRLPRAALPKPPPPPPPGLNYILPIKIAVRDLLIAHSFSILLVALLIALLYFSTQRSRRNPVFLLNVFTVLLALAVGGLIDYQTVCCFFRTRQFDPDDDCAISDTNDDSTFASYTSLIQYCHRCSRCHPIYTCRYYPAYSSSLRISFLVHR